jgi:hypothetical protein
LFVVNVGEKGLERVFPADLTTEDEYLSIPYHLYCIPTFAALIVQRTVLADLQA